MTQDAAEQHSPRPDTAEPTEAGDFAGLPLSHKMTTLQTFAPSRLKTVPRPETEIETSECATIVYLNPWNS